MATRTDALAAAVVRFLETGAAAPASALRPTMITSWVRYRAISGRRRTQPVIMAVRRRATPR
jgi:hypothetical protein